MSSDAVTKASFDWKVISIVSLGCVLEVYDFMIYALMAPYISQLFFPSSLMTESLLLTFGTFAAGYLSRPLGGILFGHQGDRQGRKKPFTFTILLMATSTLLIGCLPTHDEVGFLAPLGLVSLRLLQGISMGGETGGALTYISEYMPDRIAIGSTLIFSGMCSGLLLGYLVHYILFTVYGQDGIMSWGWRYAFWLGAVLGIIGYIIRRQFQETLMFQKIQATKQISTVPLMSVLKDYPLQTLCGALAIAIHSSTIILLNVFLPSWVQINHPNAETAGVSALAAATTAFSVLLFGYLHDRVGTTLMLKLSIASHLLLGLPWYYLVIQFPGEYWLTMPLVGLVVSLMGATQIVIVSVLFPTQVRYTGIALSYNTGFMVGGVTPLIATWLISITHQSWSPAILLTLGGLATVVVFFLFKKLRRDQRGEQNIHIPAPGEESRLPH